MGMAMNGSEWATTIANYNRASSDHTVEMTLRVDSTSGNRRPGGNTGGWESRSSGGSLVLTSDHLQSGTLITVTLNPIGQFTHVVFVQDVTNGDRFGYVDGVQVSSNLSASFSGAQNGLNNIGVSPGGAGQGWNGVVANFRVFDRALSAGEIQTLFACRGTDGIVADSLLYHMNDGVEGQTVATLYEQVQALHASNITGTPTHNYDAGLRYRRNV